MESIRSLRLVHWILPLSKKTGYVRKAEYGFNPFSNSGVLNRHNFKVDQEGDQVILRAGDVNIRMGYMIGIKLAFRLMFKSKKAKRWAGDTSKISEHIAELTDYEDDERIAQEHVVATATVIPKNIRNN